MQHPSADRTAPLSPRTHEEVLERYLVLHHQHQVRYDFLHRRQHRATLLLGAVALVLCIQAAFSIHGTGSAWPMLFSFAGLTALIVYLLRLQEPIDRARRLLLFYERCQNRVNGSEPYTANTGEDAASSSVAHLYLRDLDITGPRSLFSMLATVRTGIGERGLRKYLLTPASHGEALLRQQAVRELLPLTEQREKITLLGASSFQQLSAAFFDQWLDDVPPAFPSALRYALGATTAATLFILAAGLFRLRPWSDLFPNLLFVLAIQAALALLIRKRVLPLLEGGARLQGQVRLFAEGLALLQATSFASPKLLELQRLSREPAGAVKLLKQLESQLVIVEQRTKELFFVFSLLTAAGTQAAISIAHWKRRNAPAMRLWLEAWAEFEALNALGTYAFEHPADDLNHTWPELLPLDHTPRFEARSLGHPMLRDAICNDVELSDKTRFLLISGSNMAGKSTLLRSIGVNAVLAYAGVPVRASSLRLTPLATGASIALTDSLVEGKSKFLAEVERLAAIVRASESSPLLFLVDEIFSGTNSEDRRTAAAAVLDRLITHGAIGALSTHDLALTSLATEVNTGLNVHMGSSDPADPLAFDYRLRPGINQQSSALAIIRMLGLSSS